MMNEAYAEWLVKRKTPVYLRFAQVLMIFLCVIAFIFAMTALYGIIFLAASAVGTYFVFQLVNVEYEYLYVTGQLTIDKIMGRARRKKAWETNIDEIQIIAPADSYLLKDYEKSNLKILDFSSGESGSKTYALIKNSGGICVKVIFEPNDKMLQCFKMIAPRKVVQ